MIILNLNKYYFLNITRVILNEVGPVVQWLERIAYNGVVAGSIPARPTGKQVKLYTTLKQPIWKENELTSLQILFEVRHPAIYGISFDSRDIKAGDMFVALEGTRTHGYKYIKDALEKGACCALVSEKIHEYENIKNSDSTIVVSDPMKILEKMAVHARNRINGNVIAVTGSVGKTTMKQALAYFFKKAGFNTFATEKSYNNMLGICVSLAKMPSDTQIAVIEIGMNHPGEIEPLAQIVNPDYSIITHISMGHMEAFENLKDIAYEKGSIIKYTKKGVFFNKNLWYNHILKEIAEKNHVECFCFENQEDSLKTLREGYNSILNKFGVQFDENFEFQEGRGKVESCRYLGKKIKLIDSAYNANPASMLEAIKDLNKYKGNKIAFLGDMKELGKHEIRYHEALACYLKDIQVVGIGYLMKNLVNKLENATWYETVEDVLVDLDKFIVENSTILVKGSNSNRLKKIVEKLRSV